VRRHGTRHARSAGFTYIGLLILMAAMGMALSVVSEVWHTVQVRDKEEELLFVGNEFRHAIALYRASSGRYPLRLEDLLKDPGFPGVRRSLRKLYRDPVTGGTEWGLLPADAGGIAGVHSLSDALPVKQAGFSLADRSFEGKDTYAQWLFLAPGAQGARAALAATAEAAVPAPAAPTPATPDPGAAPNDDGLSPGRTGPRGRR